MVKGIKNMKFKILRNIILVNLVYILIASNNLIGNDYIGNPKVEVGIESIKELDDANYVISIYSINPYDIIAGIQFKFIPSDVFTIESIYGGRTEEKDFQIHFNKNGTVLGFSMIGNTLDLSRTTSGPNKAIDNIICIVNASINNLDKYNTTETLELEFVIASKDGESLSTKTVPFNMSKVLNK